MSSSKVKNRVNVKSVISTFGGQKELSQKLSAQGTPISIGGIEKWRERGQIPGRFWVALADIADSENWDFVPRKFIRTADDKNE